MRYFANCMTPSITPMIFLAARKNALNNVGTIRPGQYYHQNNFIWIAIVFARKSISMISFPQLR